MPEPTPSQLKIDGIVILPEIWTHGDFETWFQHRLNTSGFAFNGNISPLNPDAESFMVEVPRKDWDDLKKLEEVWRNAYNKQLEEKIANDKAYSDLATQLRLKENSYERLKHAYQFLQDKERSISLENVKIRNENEALKLRLRVKDSPIKAGLKSIWKWFKGLVGK